MALQEEFGVLLPKQRGTEYQPVKKKKKAINIRMDRYFKHEWTMGRR